MLFPKDVNDALAGFDLGGGLAFGKGKFVILLQFSGLGAGLGFTFGGALAGGEDLRIGFGVVSHDS